MHCTLASVERAPLAGALDFLPPVFKIAVFTDIFTIVSNRKNVTIF